jgi:sporulation-control protein
VGFKRMLGAFGVGGPSVDTVLSDPTTRPGAPLAGHVNLTGGSHDVEIEHVTLSLVTRVEVESGHGEFGATGEFHRVTVSGPMRLAEKQEISLPFQFVLPWETPITAIHGQHLRGMTMGVRTEVSIARAVDKGDLDPVAVQPLPIQERILEAFARLGFQFKNADLEYGQIHGVRQTLPFYQEIEYYPPAQYAHGINEVELTFVTNPDTVEIVLEFDKRGGMFSGGHDAYGRYTVPHADADTTDWAAVVDGWVREALSRHQSHGRPAYGGHGRHGSGMGGMVAGVAGGMAAGYLAGEVMEEVFEDDGGEE